MLDVRPLGARRRARDRAASASATSAASSPRPRTPSALAEAGIDLDFVQDNHSYSRRAACCAGCIIQLPPLRQDKLVRVVARRDLRRRGRHPPRLADLRPMGRRSSCRPSSGTRSWCPKGFAHGFVTLEPRHRGPATRSPRPIAPEHRPRDPLRRSGDRHRLAGRRRRAHAVRQGPRRAAAGRRRRRASEHERRMNDPGHRRRRLHRLAPSAGIWSRRRPIASSTSTS